MLHKKQNFLKLYFKRTYIYQPINQQLDFRNNMLKSLYIKDYALIENIDVEFPLGKFIAI